MQGFIYVLLNPLFQGNTLKIGKTTKPSEERAKEIYRKASTGIPMEYVVAYEIEVSDCDLVEKLIHEKLANKRINKDREFFHVTLKEAIKTIEKVTNDLARLKKIQFIQRSDEPFSNKKWWYELSLVWKQIFKSYLNISYQPTEVDILTAIHSIIDNSQDEKLRNTVANFIKDKDYIKKLATWYASLKAEQAKFNFYLPYEISEKEIQEILNLKEIDCQHHLAVLDLKPLMALKSIEKINCTNTSVSSFEPLRKLTHLKEIICNYTNVDSLEPLKSLPNLEKITCMGAKIAEAEVLEFQTIQPNCEINTASFLQNTPIISKQKKKK